MAPYSRISPRVISIIRSIASHNFHLKPINLIFSQGSTNLRYGKSHLEVGLHLDAFSLSLPYSYPAMLLAEQSGTPAVSPLWSSRTRSRYFLRHDG